MTCIGHPFHLAYFSIVAPYMALVHVVQVSDILRFMCMTIDVSWLHIMYTPVILMSSFFHLVANPKCME